MSDAALPNEGARPDSEVVELRRIWARPRGWRMISDVNNTTVGLFYMGIALMFFILAGALALLIRAQLAVPGNDLVGQDLFNQLFTMHGTTMMFLFAVPAMEALGVLLLPQMLAARDLPFPRLGAFAVWAYVIGGTVFFSTIFYDLAPDGGWFMYTPLTLMEFSPGDNADFWLLGIGFIEISAIAGAIEIIVGVLKTRPPGMSLARMPIFAWAMLIFAAMIVFAFPAVILATMLLEIERAFGWPFFTARMGGDPLLWQHLFWFFGHPEVYIIFLPAAGLVSMIVSTMARRPLVGHDLIVVALIGTGFFSFGLWVHHMFTTGIPSLSLAFFSAASMAVAIPSGIQVFSWIATIAAARGRLRINTPSLFVLGSVFIFTMGGVTGVMVALVPVDFQVHDTYFVVAHLHYVLMGGMVFPLFATFYFWAPMVSRNPLPKRVGRFVFWLMFAGFHLTFLPMHLTGLRGMPRRVWTYTGDVGWNWLNLISTVGAFIVAAGVLLFVIDLARRFRPVLSGGGAGNENPWDAPTLEWLPNDVYSTRSIPLVTSREPLWDQPDLAKQVEEGRHFLPNSATGERETLVTSPVEGRPQYIIRMPGPGYAHVVAAAGTAVFFLLLTVKLVVPAAIFGVMAVIGCLVWTWDLDKGGDKGLVHIGAGLKVPSYMSGPASHTWWAMVVLMLVAGSLYLAYVFSYLYLWVVSPEVWPPQAPTPPAFPWSLAVAVLALLSAGLTYGAGRLLPPSGQRSGTVVALLGLAALALTASLGLNIQAQWQTGLRPTDSAYGALVYMVSVLDGQLVIAQLILFGVAMARMLCGRLDRVRRVGYENCALLCYYTVGQMLLGLLLVHGFPRVAG